MSTADTALSLTMKMAPGPEHRQEPVAPDKTAENPRPGITDDSGTQSSTSATEIVDAQNASEETTTVRVSSTEPSPDLTKQNLPPLNSGTESKQEEPAKLSTLNEGELRALLDEAITYKCPKDREGKSNLFKELLQEAEADETEEGHMIVANSRCLPGSNRRRHKRDSVSERLTHGGSLQNLAQPITSEFDSSFAYLTSGSSHTYGGNRRKNKKYSGPSVSARQREGGSLPSNVNASHSLASLVNLDLLFDKKKGFSEERTAWASKEKSKSLDKPVCTTSKKEDKEKKDRRENKKDSSTAVCEVETDTHEKRNNKGKYGTNEMLGSDSLPPEYKSDYMVIDLSDIEVRTISNRNVGSTVTGVQRPHSLDTEDDEGTEMKTIEPGRPVKFIARATFDITQTPVDSTIEFPFHDHNSKPDKSKITVNGTEVSGSLPLQTYNSVKCVISGTVSNPNSTQAKVVPSLCSVMPAPWPSSNITMEGPRYVTPHITMKDTASSGEKKSLDENGNAVQGYNGDNRKKPRRKHTQEPNVIVYQACDVKGHREDTDIDSLLNFIENKESKGKKGKSNNTVRVKASSGTKPRSREKDSKREQLPTKLQKSNSLEEISKTKLEDLTAEKSVSSSGTSSVSSQHGTINVSLRRAKQRSTGDATVDSRGDRRSWGTEEGQSIYCNDTGEEYSSRRNSTKKMSPEPEPEPDFLVVTKKKKSKKQRRSSSGSRAQNLGTSGSYLQHSRGFSTEYRTPLSPELGRKIASSMPPSDKSDSSDVDSVHSLPVTSNSTKHNLPKVATSSGGTPQASYADITRMATINMAHNSVLSAIVPTMLNTTSWPSVPPKTSSEPDKITQDYYPSLDELQNSDKKARQHNIPHLNNMHSLNFNFDKLSSSMLTKMKHSSDRTKAEDREEVINKNIQVIKYVQDYKKMQQEQILANANNCSPISNDSALINIQTQKLNITAAPCNLTECDNNSPNDNSNKDSNANFRQTNPRTRRVFQQSNAIVQVQSMNSEQPIQKVGSLVNEDVKKTNHVSPSSEAKTNLVSSLNDENESQKLKQKSNTKTLQEQQSFDSDSSKTVKTEKPTKAVKESQNNLRSDTVKSMNSHPPNTKDEPETSESNDVKQQNQATVDKEQSQKPPEQQVCSKKNVCSRPAVILLDETASDDAKANDLPTELTFGFEINEQLLLSEDLEETQTAAPVLSTETTPPIFDKQSTKFDKPPAAFEKHLRYEKFPSNFHPHTPTVHVNQHSIHPPLMTQALPYMGYPTRFSPRTFLPSPPPPPPGIMEKYHQQPIEDFSMRFIAPKETVNVQNHDNIVTFVGLAWDAVMREMPVTTATGRVRYYSGQ